MVQVLSTLQPDHEIFNKDYCRPRASHDTQLMVDNPFGYFDGLPLSTQKSKHRLSLVDSTIKLEQNLNRIQAKLEMKMRKVETQKQVIEQKKDMERREERLMRHMLEDLPV